MGQDAFITTWETTTSSESITIPVHPDSTYDFDVDWNEGGTSGPTDTFSGTGSNLDVSHTYPNSGTHTVEITSNTTGGFPHIFLNAGEFGTGNTTNAKKLQSIDQWGTIVWGSMVGAFSGAENLTYNATDNPDLSNVTSTAEMFDNAASFNGAIGSWDVSNVTTMRSMFDDASSFNQDLSGWDTGMSNVTTTFAMFDGATSFNGDVTGWDVSSVTDMRSMFRRTDNFNQDISGWNVSSAQKMGSMFRKASAFNQPIGNWGADVSNVTEMFAMFRGATSFNQDISSWDVSSVTNMSAMFLGATNFNQPLDAWGSDVSSVRNTNFMFQNADSFNQDLNSWSVQNDTTMFAMFDGATNFNGDVTGWDVSSVTDMRSMFKGTAFNRDISGWNVSNVEKMGSMFKNASNFNQPIGNWGADVGNVTDMFAMFRGATSFNQDISSWDVSSVTNMSAMFLGATNFNQPLDNWGSDVSGVTNMDFMFQNASSFNQDLNSWTVGNVNSMFAMFDGATNFNGDVTGWDVSSVTDMQSMFRDTAFNRDIGSWNVANVTEMGSMFANASSFNQDLNSWDVSSVTGMFGMFSGATNFNGNITGWNVANVATMEAMFQGASSFDQDIGGWNVSSVTDMKSMFNGANSFNQDLGEWDVSNVDSDFTNFLAGANVALSPAHYDSLLIGWEQRNLTDGLTFDAPNSQYTASATTARDNLINNEGWTINDAGQNKTSITVVGTEGNEGEASSGTLGGDAGWYMIGPPVQGATAGDIKSWERDPFVLFDLAVGNMLYEWDDTIGSSPPGDWSPLASAGDAFDSGRGHILFLFDDNDEPVASNLALDIAGSLTVPSGDTTVSSLNQDAQYHLLANPYNEPFDITGLEGTSGNNIGSGNTDFSSTVQIWDGGASSAEDKAQKGSYVDIPVNEAINSGSDNMAPDGDIISAWQGFVVERSNPGSGDTELTFTTNGQTSGTRSIVGSKVHDDAEQPRYAHLGLKMTVTNKTGAQVARDEAISLFFHERATPGWDAFDASKLEPLSAQYAVLSARGAAHADTTTMKAVESRPLTIDDPVEVPLHLQTEGDLAGTARIGTDAWQQIPDRWTITLIDTKGTASPEDDTETTLSPSSPYTFELSSSAAKSGSQTKRALPASGPPEALPRPPAVQSLTTSSPSRSKSSDTEAPPRFRLRVDPKGTPLPAETTDLNADANGQALTLTWSIPADAHHTPFYVDHQRLPEDASTPASDDWTEVARVKAGGKSSGSTRTYQHRLSDLDYGEHAVRLRQVDVDGTEATGTPVKTHVKLDAPYDIAPPSPNPVRTRATLDVTVRRKQRVTVQLYDLLGRHVRTVHDAVLPANDLQTFSLSTNRLSSGPYFVRIRGQDFSTTKRMHVVK